MEGYGASTYGDLFADVYDQWYGPDGDIDDDTADAAEFLAGLAGPGPALELAIGTGRVALPLAGRGVEVHGLDASEAMIARLRAKPGGERIPVTVGDMADVAVGGRFPLVYLVFNTIFALTTQAEQVRCFRNVAARLADGGAFVVEAFVPDLSRYPRGQGISLNRMDVDQVTLDVSRHDPVMQTVDSQHVVLRAEGIRLQPIRIRYAWPAELDLTAQLAGLRLAGRWAGWRREPFTASASTHVSVYVAATREPTQE